MGNRLLQVALGLRMDSKVSFGLGQKLQAVPLRVTLD